MRVKELLDISKRITVESLIWELAEFAAYEEPKPDWFAFEAGESFRVVGKDACGGRFCLVPDEEKGKLVCIDSEGRAAVIANMLAEGLQMMIALPYWRDCLGFSGGGKLPEMKRTQAYFEADLLRRRPDIEETRSTLYRTFGLAKPDHPLERLHAISTQGKNAKAIATRDGSPLEALFGSYTVDTLKRHRQ